MPEAGHAFNNYMTEEELDTGIKKGDFIRGKYRVNRNNPNEGIVNTQFGFEVKVIGKTCNNRAILGDVVAVRLLDESKWLNIKTVDIAEEDEADNDNFNRRSVSTTDDRKYASLKERIVKENLCPLAEVVGIIKRDLRNLAGQISKVLLKTPVVTYALVDPVDARFPSTIMAVRSLEALKNKKIIFNVDSWPNTQAYPIGHLVGVFGEADDPLTESKVILFEHNVETRPFSQAVLNCLPQEGANYTISEAELKKRKDLRDYPIVGSG